MYLSTLIIEASVCGILGFILRPKVQRVKVWGVPIPKKTIHTELIPHKLRELCGR